MKEFPRKLRELIKLRRTSQEKVGRAIGKPQQTIHKYCSGVSEPELSFAGKLAEFLGVPLDYLYNDAMMEVPGPPSREAQHIAMQIKTIGIDEAIRRLANVHIDPIANRPTYGESREAETVAEDVRRLIDGDRDRRKAD